MKKDKLGFWKKVNAWRRLKKTLPKKIANTAKNHFTDSFKQGGFTDTSFKAWVPRKSPDRGRSRGNRAVLVKSGALRRDVRVKRADFSNIKLAASLPYAPVHNFGLRAGRGKGFKMPIRKFIGKSYVLERKLLNQIEYELNKLP